MRPARDRLALFVAMAILSGCTLSYTRTGYTYATASEDRMACQRPGLTDREMYLCMWDREQRRSAAADHTARNLKASSARSDNCVNVVQGGYINTSCY